MISKKIKDKDFEIFINKWLTSSFQSLYTTVYPYSYYRYFVEKQIEEIILLYENGTLEEKIDPCYLKAQSEFADTLPESYYLLLKKIITHPKIAIFLQNYF